MDAVGSRVARAGVPGRRGGLRLPCNDLEAALPNHPAGLERGRPGLFLVARCRQGDELPDSRQLVHPAAHYAALLPFGDILFLDPMAFDVSFFSLRMQTKRLDGSLELDFDAIDNDVAVAPVLVEVPGHAAVRSFEIQELFGNLEQHARDHIGSLHSWEDEEVVNMSIMTTNNPEHDQGEASHYDLDDRLAYMVGKIGRPVKSDFTWARWRRMLESFGWRCAYCGAQRELEQDHCRAIVNGGSDLMDNILPSCHPCNASKGQCRMITWLGRRGRVVCEAALERIEKGRAAYRRRT